MPPLATRVISQGATVTGAVPPLVIVYSITMASRARSAENLLVTDTVGAVAFTSPVRVSVSPTRTAAYGKGLIALMLPASVGGQVQFWGLGQNVDPQLSSWAVTDES